MEDDHLDDWQPWQRAVWLIHARHGLVHNEKIGEKGVQGNPAEIPIEAIRELVVDLMHYCHERNKHVDAAASVDFIELVMSAEDDFIRQREAIPEEDPRLHKDHPELRAADPAKDPELAKLLIDLQNRQAKEARALLDRQHEQPLSDDPDSQERQNQKERDKLVQKFKQERDRYISEYQEARKIAEQIDADDKPKGFDFNQLLDDGPKFSK